MLRSHIGQGVQCCATRNMADIGMMAPGGNLAFYLSHAAHLREGQLATTALRRPRRPADGAKPDYSASSSALPVAALAGAAILAGRQRHSSRPLRCRMLARRKGKKSNAKLEAREKALAALA
eukprot:2749279-Amphidinium_carterae.1